MDKRLTPARPDVAAKYLEGKVDAERFVIGEEFEITDGVTAIRRDPFAGAMLDSQALRGERFTVYDRNDEGWAWGQLASDGYVGWISDLALYPPGPTPTHKVTALRTFAFPGPSIKIPPMDTLSLGALLSVVKMTDAFAVTSNGHHVPKQHVAELSFIQPDFVAIAERFVGTPYLWGGRSSLGIDCSGLVQAALTAAGTGCPRDSDMQENGLGRALSETDMQTLKRGDLIFWKGHVAIVRDAHTIVHANAHHMMTAIEDTKGAIARIAATGSGVTSIKRLN